VFIVLLDKMHPSQEGSFFKNIYILVSWLQFVQR